MRSESQKRAELQMCRESPRAQPPIWVQTPCINPTALSRIAGCNIFLKLENLQPSGSFKSRSVGNMVYQAFLDVKNNLDTASLDVHFYCSSGGNAGLACVMAATALGSKATIVVPTTTSDQTIAKLRDRGATVIQYGNILAQTDAYMRDVVMSTGDPKTEKAVYVPPFDHEDIWRGASTLIPESWTQMGGANPVDAIVCSVGGGGLFCGIMRGLSKYDKEVMAKTKVLAMETEGAASLNASVMAGRLVTLPGLNSIANSLGAVRVAQQAFQWTQSHPETVVSRTVTDRDTVVAAAKFLDECRILVEPACSASLAPIYNGTLRHSLYPGISDEEWAQKNVLVILCGGSNVSLGALQKWMKDFGVEV